MPGSTIVEMNAHDFLADCENEPTVWAQESKALDRNLRRVAVLVTYRHPLQLILGEDEQRHARKHPSIHIVSRGRK